MPKIIILLPLVLAFFMLYGACFGAEAVSQFETDEFDTSEGSLKITFIGHGTLMFQFNNMVIHVDPYSRLADYKTLPKADLILITHEHLDHLDLKALEPIRKPDTIVVMTDLCSKQISDGIIMKNGDKKTVRGLHIEAVPAYNILHKRDTGQPFHPRGDGNGYVVSFGDKKIYIAADTENIPEMANLKGIDIAFLPMNLPFTMTPAMTAAAARVIKPKILYPYHYGNTDPAELLELLKDNKEIEVRIRKMR